MGLVQGTGRQLVNVTNKGARVNIRLNPPLRVRLAVAPIDPTAPAAMKEERNGQIRKSIQGQSGGAVAAAGERAAVLRVANQPRFADVPPARIVPMLADENVYLASESTFHRVLREHGQTRHRGRVKAPRKTRPPTTHIASAPGQMWCWDMTYLPAIVQGRCSTCI